VEAALVIGGVRAGLAAEMAARDLRLVAVGTPGETARVAIRFPDAVGEGPSVLTLHVIDGGERAVAAALDAGADDAVQATASNALIAARLAAVLRHAGEPAALRVGPLAIDRVDHAATREGRPLGLLPREYALLLYLACHAGAVVSREALHSDVWGLRHDPGTNRIEAHVSRLRAKLDRGFGKPMLLTEKGVGYRLAEP
jgi:two-component system OmpR family response regulator